MKAYIRKNFHNEIASHNFYAAYDGFRQMGFEIVYYQQTVELSNASPENVVVGYVRDVKEMLLHHGMNVPAIGYPEEIHPYLGRKIWTSKLSAVANNPDRWNVFIKPLENKQFDGVVVRSTRDLIGCGVEGEDPEILCSEVIHFVAEWRCFVRYGQIVDVRRYRGDWRLHFDARMVEEAVRSYVSAPNGYAIDFGLTDDGRTIVIEINDGYALGYYGLENLSYAKLLAARWAQLTDTVDECHF